MGKLAISGGKPVGRMEIPCWPLYDKTDIKSIEETIESKIWGICGEQQKILERNFAEFCDCKYAVSAANGTVSLKMALEAIEIQPYDEVILPGLTWQATALAVLEVNAVPIIVDIDLNTYTIDPLAIEQAITPKTKAIIVVHLYCRIANMDRIIQISKKYGLKIIEDCAHQHGSKWRSKSVGTIGDIGSFSMQSSKILTSGEGGLLTTNNKKYFEYLQSLKNFSKPYQEYANCLQGGNYRLSEIQASLAITQLAKLDIQNTLRDNNASYLDECIDQIDGVCALAKQTGTTFQTYYMYVMKYNLDYWNPIPKELFVRALYDELKDSNIVIDGTYEPLNHCQYYKPLTKKTFNISKEYWEDIDPEKFGLPSCDKAREEAITFLHPMLLTDKDGCDKFIEAICKIQKYKFELEKRV